ncbi:UNVERIFIED_CONTAM: hypothetical protein Sindi_1060000 [Sesamum indicum]
MLNASLVMQVANAPNDVMSRLVVELNGMVKVLELSLKRQPLLLVAQEAESDLGNMQ